MKEKGDVSFNQKFRSLVEACFFVWSLWHFEALFPLIVFVSKESLDSFLTYKKESDTRK